MKNLKLAKIVVSDTNDALPSWFNNDKWEYRDLGINSRTSETYKTFSFKAIQQGWLKEAIKKYVYKTSFNKSSYYVRGVLGTMGMLSGFLQNKKRINSLADVDRPLILDLYVHLNKLPITDVTAKNRVVYLSRFFNYCHDEELIPFKGKLIYEEEIPRANKVNPRFIPDNILEKFNAVISELDQNIYNIVMVLQETGMRSSEVIHLPFDCIFQDQSKDYFLQYKLSKIKREHVIPISHDLAKIIKTQQEMVKQEWGSHRLLFPLPKYTKQVGVDRYRKNYRAGETWHRYALSRHLKKFTKHHNITDDTGKIWYVRLHEFRHTLATKMINNDVPQHIVQKFLGHESPTMTAKYAHILDQTLKEAFLTFRGKNVNITGEIIESKDVVLQIMQGSDPKEIDALWLKKNIMAQALPNGTCALPAISKSCPHANACLTCTNFRTDHRHLKTHKQQLTKTNEIIKQAKKNNWQRQLEMNVTIKDNLEKIINTLEEAV